MAHRPPAPAAVPYEDEDRELLLAAARGEEAAVRQLYRAHVARVARCAIRVLGRDDGDVDDVIQQTFLAALDGAPRFDGRSRLSTWLLGIATRRALDQVRSRQRRGRWDRVREWVGLGRPSALPDTRSEALSTAEAALATLNVDQRTVFVLHAVEGYTLKEVSGITGVGISTLHARYKAARKRLDAALEALEGEQA